MHYEDLDALLRKRQTSTETIENTLNVTQTWLKANGLSKRKSVMIKISTRCL
jgi:hypothetical protein